jgi:hypothetical protein
MDRAKIIVVKQIELFAGTAVFRRKIYVQKQCNALETVRVPKYEIYKKKFKKNGV